MSFEVVGVKDAIRSLNKVEPGLRRKFNAEATEIVRPIIVEAENRYTFRGWGVNHIKGVSRSWKSKGRQIGKFNIGRAAKGVRTQLNSDRRTLMSVLVVQFNAAAAVLETAGRRNKNRLGDVLGGVSPGTSRVLGPAVYSKRREISDELEKRVLGMVNKVNRELK